MKAIINPVGRVAYLEGEGIVRELEDWTILVRRRLPVGARGYTVLVGGVHTLADAVRRGPPSPPPTPCCDCTCHSKGE